MKRRIVPIDDDLRDDGGNGRVDAAPAQCLGQALLDVIADHALAHGAAHVKRHGGRNVHRMLVLQHDAAYLRPVAMRDDDLIPALDDVRNVFRCLFHDRKLRFCRRRALALLQCVAAQCNDQFLHKNPPESVVLDG